MNRTCRTIVLAAAMFPAADIACGAESSPVHALVLTQTPLKLAPAAAADVLDARYPAGSRVVLSPPPFDPARVRVLSGKLSAAGGPVLTPDGRRVLFNGKTGASDPWQIYEVPVNGGGARAITSVAGGTMSPALLANGDIVFASPVPVAIQNANAALFAQTPGAPPRRLTFGTAGAIDPTVLPDGRILFVSAPPASDGGARPGLFTINNDGTEFTAFACVHDAPAALRRPRELYDGHIGFLSAPAADGDWRAEIVSKARPFLSREALLVSPAGGFASVEPGENGSRWVSAEFAGAGGARSFAVFQLAAGADALGQPRFDDPAWNDLEAVPVIERPRPQGHISAMNPAKATGQILCLDVNRSQFAPLAAGAGAAAKVRVTAAVGSSVQTLGEIPLQADGSFLAEVPVDTPIGFESLDAQGRVLRRSPPSLWVRAGENRSCIGCHEPHNRAPRNARPLAVNLPPVVLRLPSQTVARQTR